mgnify:CR=1 FL=1
MSLTDEQIGWERFQSKGTFAEGRQQGSVSQPGENENNICKDFRNCSLVNGTAICGNMMEGEGLQILREIMSIVSNKHHRGV